MCLPPVSNQCNGSVPADSGPVGVARTPRREDEQGSALAELVIIAPALLLVALLMIFFGRIESAQGDVEAAARAGVEAAVVQSSAPLAQSSATAAVTATLSSEHMACPTPEVTTDVSNFYSGGSVSVAVTCVARLSDVAAPGLPGARTLSATSTAPIDPYTTVSSGYAASLGTVPANPVHSDSARSDRTGGDT
jgi:Flp pilus assembly protein TadG